MTRNEMWFGICSCFGACHLEIEHILQVMGEPSALYGKEREKMLTALTEGTAKTGRRPILLPKQAEALRRCTQEETIRQEMEKLTQKGIRFISIDDPAYPKRLTILKDAPFGLYVKGNLPSEEPTCGMVGARACSAYGRAMSERFAVYLAKEQVQIISGMALGIDGMCSRGALKAGGKTFVVLGSGVDVIYPKENTDLYYEILMKGGGIISEYPPGTAPLAWQFPYRNRLIAALSDLLLVMEARKRSGTLSTVACALDLGKDVYALPGRITDPLSESCNLLIREGAGMLTTPEEIAQILRGGVQNGGVPSGTVPSGGVPSGTVPSGGVPEENGGAESRLEGPAEAAARQLYLALEWEAKSLEEICRKAGMKAQEAASLITLLVLDGWAKEAAPGYYEKAR